MESYTADTFDTFSLTQYTREVEQFPRLAPDETALLGQRILLANEGYLSWAEGMAARDRLIHGHLHLVLSLAQYYPHDLRDDLVQEGNIGLMEAVEQYDFRNGDDFATYAIATIRHAIIDAIEVALPIRIPRSSVRYAKQHGKAHLLPEQPASLEWPLQQDASAYLADTLSTPEPSVETEICQEKHTHASDQSLDTLLESLPSLTRLVIELRYGLDAEDQREHSYAQIADRLGITKSAAHKLEHSGLATLKGKRLQREQLRRMAQESRLNAAFALLQQAHVRINTRQLAATAKVGKEAAAAYLQRVKQTDPQSCKAATGGLGEKTYAKLFAAFRRLEEQNIPVSALALQKATGVHWNTAKKFLDHRAQLYAQTVEQAIACQVMEA